MQKRGQITVFIVIGIIILAVVLGMVYLSKYVVKEELEAREEEVTEAVLMTDPIKMFVEGCLKEATEEALLFIGERGGYKDLPPESTRKALVNTPYYLDNVAVLIPSEKVIEEQLAKLIEEKVSLCTDDFTMFKSLEITEGEIKATPTLRSKFVIVDLEYPLKIRREEEIELKDFEVKVPCRLKDIYNIAQDITLTQKGEEMICLTCIGLIGLQNDLEIQVVTDTVDEEGNFFNIFDHKNKIDEEPFLFRFAIK